MIRLSVHYRLQPEGWPAKATIPRRLIMRSYSSMLSELALIAGAADARRFYSDGPRNQPN